MAKKASVWKRRDGCGKGWNTLALCGGFSAFLFSCSKNFIVLVFLRLVGNDSGYTPGVDISPLSI